MRSYDIQILDEKGKLAKTITIKPVKRKNLADLVEANKIIIESFLKYNGGVGSALADDTIWVAMEKIAKITPVLGQAEDGFDISYLESDYETLSKLFFTTNEPEETLDANKSIKPSIISSLNYLDFPGEMGKAFKRLREEAEKEEQAKEVKKK